MIESKNGPEKSYVVTEKGRRFLDDFAELQKHAEVVEAKKRTLEKSLAA